MIARAAKLWEVDEANVQFADGEFSCINGKEEQISSATSVDNSVKPVVQL